MQTIAIANHKGGVGKTATTHALGELLAEEHGLQVLLVDADPQASLTQACGIADAAEGNLATLLDGRARLSDIVCSVGALTLIPGDIALAATELGLVSRMGRENVLKRALAPESMVSSSCGPFDVCLIDCPPSLGLLTVNALTAADGVLIPTQPEIQALRGLRLFLDSLDQVREALNPSLATVGIVATLVDPRLRHHQEALQLMRDAGLPLLPVTIGRSVRVAEAAAAGQSVVTFEPQNPQAQAYREIAEEVATWLSDDRR
jgi:chromosome partitioning protein